MIDGIGTACSVPHDDEEPITITFSRGPYPTERANAAMAQNDRLGDLTNQWSPVTGGSAAHTTRRGGRRAPVEQAEVLMPPVVHVPGSPRIGCFEASHQEVPPLRFVLSL